MHCKQEESGGVWIAMKMTWRYFIALCFGVLATLVGSIKIAGCMFSILICLFCDFNYTDVFRMAWKPKIMGELFVNWKSLSNLYIYEYIFILWPSEFSTSSLCDSLPNGPIRIQIHKSTNPHTNLIQWLFVCIHGNGKTIDYRWKH
jgi:hypothetical protein